MMVLGKPDLPFTAGDSANRRVDRVLGRQKRDMAGQNGISLNLAAGARALHRHFPGDSGGEPRSGTSSGDDLLASIRGHHALVGTRAGPWLCNNVWTKWVS